MNQEEMEEALVTLKRFSRLESGRAAMEGRNWDVGSSLIFDFLDKEAQRRLAVLLEVELYRVAQSLYRDLQGWGVDLGDRKLAPPYASLSDL